MYVTIHGLSAALTRLDDLEMLVAMRHEVTFAQERLVAHGAININVRAHKACFVYGGFMRGGLSSRQKTNVANGGGCCNRVYKKLQPSHHQRSP